MTKLITAALFTMFATVGIASRAGASADPVPVVNSCQATYAACTADCLDFVGNAKGACLRLCRAEYDECMAN